jgi:Galactose oxidase, central domain/Secretion system C-terminal sorting domain/Kelch motif
MRLLFIFLLAYNFSFGQVWSQLPDFPSTKRDDGVVALVGNKAYFGTGLQEGWSATIDFQELNLSTHTWTNIPNLPNTKERQYACAFAGNNSFYVFGGGGYLSPGIVGALNNLYKYDISTRSWKEMSPKPGEGIIAATCFQFGDRVIIASGRLNGPGTVNHEVWEYTISTDSWKQKKNFPFDGRWRASGTVLHNFGHLLFGIDSFNVFRKELYRYDHNVDAWTKVSDFPMARGRAYAAMQGVAEKLMVFGGVDSSNVFYNDVWYYNDILNTWSPETSLPSFARKGGMACVANDNFYYSCGISATSRLNETWMTDPAKDVLSIFVPATQNGSEKIVVRLVNTFGNETLKQEITFNMGSRIDLTNLSAGIYFVQIYEGNQIIKNAILAKH